MSLFIYVNIQFLFRHYIHASAYIKTLNILQNNGNGRLQAASACKEFSRNITTVGRLALFQ